jgi:hypothetical protein
MITPPQSAQSSIGAHGAIAGVHLLDVRDINGNVYYWASRKTSAPSVIVAAGGSASNAYKPWILNVGKWTFNASMETDSGSLTLQNLSGDTLQRDFEKIARATVLKGAFAVYRYWHAAAEWASIEVHGSVSVDDRNPAEVKLTMKQLPDTNSDIAPASTYGEICPWRWGSDQCGSTAATPCKQTFLTCQVVERPLIVLNSYEQNFGETAANVSVKQQNRIRQF